MTPEQNLLAALDGMPELAEAIAGLRQWVLGRFEVPVPTDYAAFALGVGHNRANAVLAIIDRAAGS